MSFCVLIIYLIRHDDGGCETVLAMLDHNLQQNTIECASSNEEADK